MNWCFGLIRGYHFKGVWKDRRWWKSALSIGGLCSQSKLCRATKSPLHGFSREHMVERWCSASKKFDPLSVCQVGKSFAFSDYWSSKLALKHLMLYLSASIQPLLSPNILLQLRTGFWVWYAWIHLYRYIWLARAKLCRCKRLGLYSIESIYLAGNGLHTIYNAWKYKGNHADIYLQHMSWYLKVSKTLLP